MTLQVSAPGGRTKIRTGSAVALLAASVFASVNGLPARASADSVPVISTIAGGAGGPGPARELPAGGCVVTYSGGSLYTQSSTGAIRKISLKSGQLTTVLGTGVGGPVTNGQRGPASNLEPSSCGIAVDAHGNLLFSDGENIGPHGRLFSGNNLVRVLATTSGRFYGQSMTAGDAYTIAGDGSFAFSGDGGPAIGAELADPAGLAVDQAGNVIVADAYYSRIRVIAEKTGTFYGQPMTAGDIYTVAGGGSGHKIGDGGPGTKAVLSLGPRISRFGSPIANYPGQLVRVDHQGNIVVADQNDNRIRVIAGRAGRYYGKTMKAGFIYTVAGGGHRHLADGGPATRALLRHPSSIAIDHAGNVVIADMFNQRIRVAAVRSGRFYGVMMKAGDIYTVAGDGTAGIAGNGGPARKAALSYPLGVSVDGAGNIVISGQCMRTVLHQSLIVSQDCLRVVASAPGRYYGMAMKRGDIYAISGGQGSHFGDGGPALHAEFGAGPYPIQDGFAASATGELAIADSDDARVRLVAAVTGKFFGQAMTAGDIYTIAGNGQFGYSGNGGNGADAVIGYPAGLAFDHAGNLLIADTGNWTLRVVAVRSGTFYGRAMTGGHIYTLAGNGKQGTTGDGGPATAAQLDAPAGVTVDQAGNLVIADDAIRVIATSTGTFYGQAMTAGDIYQVAALPGNGATAVALDPAGNLVVVVFRSVYAVAEASGTFYGQAMTAGNTYLIAGSSNSNLPPVSGVPATAVDVEPDGLALDVAGNLVLPGESYHFIEVVARSSGTFYGTAMTAGDIYTIAGGKEGMGLGDGGPAVDASFEPLGVAVPSSGAIDVETPTRIRQLSGW